MSGIKVWRDLLGKTFELKTEKGEWRHRQKGTQKWKKGRPPGMVAKAKIPVDKRSRE